MKGKKWKLLFTVLAIAGLGLTSCTINGEPQGGGDDNTPVTPAHEHTYQGYQHDEHDHWQVCTGCQEATAKQAHSGGTATCEHKAVCSVCGAEYGELGAHQYGTLVAKVDPTCTTDGVAAHYQCSVCHKYFTEQKVETTLEALKLVKTGHHGTLHEAHAATCTEAGNTAYYECSGCHKYYSDAECEHEIQANSWVVAALGHQPQAHAAHAATCTEAGNSAYYQCERCHKYFSDEACAHEIQANSWVIAALGHHGTLHEAHAATCTEAGNSEYYQCNHCHKFFSDELGNNEIAENSWVIAPTSHTFDVDYPEIKTLGTYRHAYHHCSECDKLYMLDKNSQYVEIADDDAAWENALCQYNDPEFVSSESNPYIIKYDADIIFLRNHTNAAANDTFEGKFLKMVEDIDLGNDADHPFGTPIGTGDAKPFSGTFDGDGHTISNIYISPIQVDESTTRGDALALFSRVTGGTVKNLKLANVNVTTTVQRTAALVARASNATISNIEVLSGTLAGVKENGGVVGIALDGVEITNCINRANLTGSEGQNGGIIGLVFRNDITIRNCKNYGNITGGVTNIGTDSKPVYSSMLGGIIGRGLGTGTITISDCENEGTITTTAASGSGIGVGGILGNNTSGVTIDISRCINRGEINGREAAAGIMGQLRTGTLRIDECINEGNVNAATGDGSAGILGSSLANGTASISITNSDNFGTISGYNYVGGIAGLPRKSTAASEINGCNNYGDISASNTACGGIIGLARINVRNCGCYYNATLTNKTTVKKASETTETNATATPGYITSIIQADSSNSNGAEMTGCKLITAEEYTITVSGSVPNIFADGAKIYVWAWGGTVAGSGAWYRAYKIADNQIKVFVPTDMEGMLVARLSAVPGATFDNSIVWNQSANITNVASQFAYETTM